MTSVGTTDFVDINDPLSLDLIPDEALNIYASLPFYIQQVGELHAEKDNLIRRIIAHHATHAGCELNKNHDIFSASLLPHLASCCMAMKWKNPVFLKTKG